MAYSDDELEEEDDDQSASFNMIIADASAVAPPPQNAPPDEVAEEDSAIARRRAIQSIMRDTSLTDEDKRMQIQNLMSGGRIEVAPPPAPVIPEHDNTNCAHYERNCSIVAPCCNRVFGCRVCHDEASASGHPPMDRFLVREVVCKKCNTRQPPS